MADSSGVAGLYSSPLPSSRTGAFYNMFSYPTKISPESIAVYIAAHTRPGDVVLDVFGGSGSTGIAALMCEHPTPGMLALSERLGLTPLWGARNAILYEIGTYGSFASRLMADPPSVAEFSQAVDLLISWACEKVGDLYAIDGPDGTRGFVRHVVHSDVMACPDCGGEFTYYEGMVRHDPLAIDGKGICPHCGHADISSSFAHVMQTVFDPLIGQAVTRRKRVPVRVYGQSGKEKWVRDAIASDISQTDGFADLPYPHYCRSGAIEWGELYRAGYHAGITHLHHFYTRRNFTVASFLWERSFAFPTRTGDAIRLLLLSYNSAHATLMTRVVVKKNSRDFVLTGAQSGVLYVSSLPVEKNIIEGIRRKRRNFEEAFAYLQKCSGKIEVFNASSRHLGQAGKSVDYIFTDPPFGDFIPYAEVNQLNELWLAATTDRKEEIIISRSQNKDLARYQEMMTDVFREMRRVLKDGCHATMVFHSSKAAVWNALCSAYSDAGFEVAQTASLDKRQASFKQVVSPSSVQGDPLILLSKGIGRAAMECDSQTVLDEAIARESLAQSGDGTVRKIYAEYVSACLRRGIAVGYDAKDAYSYIAGKAGGQA